MSDNKGPGYIMGSETNGTDKVDTINALVTADHANQIKLRTMSWQKTACLLAGEQVCLAIMVQSWSLSYIMKHPLIMDICDFGYYVFGQSKTAYIFSAFMMLSNNILLVGFHVLTGAKVLNTLSNHSLCTAVFSIITALVGILMSMPRTLQHISFMSMVSSACMGIAIILFLVFARIEDGPLHGYKGDYPTDGPVKTYAFPLPGTTWVACLNAVLNIAYLWASQILFPTFISEMERPQDFPKALAVLAGISAILFIVPSAIGLGVVSYKKSSFGFVIVPTLVIGVIYANVTGKLIYARILGKSRHSHSHTVIGWSVWVAIMVGIWYVVGFVFAEIIPSMGDFLSLLSAAFDSFFAFIYFAVAYWRLNRGSLFNSVGKTALTLLNVLVMMVGLFLLGPGLYAAVEAMIADYSRSVTPAFTCANIAF
ncbi:Amino acid transporter, transmembrane [Penicillium griseofulvum]|uniref:Amino acid transporter, transmembrane n=1 Tax=Penicillium patulum TaxID=5078 RepID=A0A135LNU1_PENPA|nr:Amino acid transporter, transmembrane [Penicillium griseofulvum]KXG50628.1 Amino acid transporter, transmembrane [Penicillium griseofulvum]